MTSVDLVDWDDLKIFLAVARTGNLAQTARLLRVDYSTVSRRVAQLETALGHGVFERSRTGFRMNDLGERLLVRAETIESEIIGIRSEMQEEVSSAADTVKLATVDGIASLYPAPRVVFLKEIVPNSGWNSLPRRRLFTWTGAKPISFSVSSSRPVKGLCPGFSERSNCTCTPIRNIFSRSAALPSPRRPPRNSFLFPILAT